MPSALQQEAYKIVTIGKDHDGFAQGSESCYLHSYLTEQFVVLKIKKIPVFREFLMVGTTGIEPVTPTMSTMRGDIKNHYIAIAY